MIWFPFFIPPIIISLSNIYYIKATTLVLPVCFRNLSETPATMYLRLIVAFFLILRLFEVNGVHTGTGGPILACHVPLEVKIFADSSYQAASADLKSCTQIILSSVNALFLPSSNASLASILVSEKRSLGLLKQQTPEAEFSFSLRSTHTLPPIWNLKTIFNRTTSVALLVEFLRINKLKSFDIAWDLIQSAPDYGPQLKSLKATLAKEGFNLTTTIGVEVDRIDAFHVTKIASIVDRIFLVSSYNRHYSGSQYPLTDNKVEQAFDALEFNEGAFLKLYSTLNLSWKKIVVGLSLRTLVWKLKLGKILGTQFSQYQAVLQLQSYYESCKIVNSTWRLQQQPNPFYQLAVAPTNDEWMIHVDPLTLGKRVNLLRQYGFGGVALYDYYQDDFAGICNSKGKIYPLIQQAGQSIRNSSVAVPFPEVDANNGLCIPFVGLTNECKGAFNFGTPKISINSVEFTSTSSTTPVTKTTLPVVNDSTTTRVSSQYTTESVTIPSSSTSGATVALAASWVQMADLENLVRSRRSSVSSGVLGTEPSYSYLRPPGFELVDITPIFSSSNSKVKLPALQSLTTASVSPHIVTEASKVKVELLRDDKIHLAETVATFPSQTLALLETAGNQALFTFQESAPSTMDIVSSKFLPRKLEIPTVVESEGDVPVTSTSLPELGTLTETEQTITHLQNSIGKDASLAPPTLPTSEIGKTIHFPITSTGPSSQEGIASSLQIEMELPTHVDLQVEATTDVTSYAYSTREIVTNFMDEISTENAMVDVTFSLTENRILPNAEQLSLVHENNENIVAHAEEETDLYDSSTTSSLTSIDQEPIASSEYSGSVADLLEHTTSQLSILSTNNQAESTTTISMRSAAFDTMEYPATTLSPQSLFSSSATETFKKNSPVSDVFSTISIDPLDLADTAFTSATPTDEQERYLHLSSASLMSKEGTESLLNMDFSTPYDSISLKIDAEMESEKNFPTENSFSVATSSVPEWNTAEETFGSETPLLHSTVFDSSTNKDHDPKFQGAIGTDSSGTIFFNQLATKESASVVEEGSAEGSIVSTKFFPTFETILSEGDVSKFLTRSVTETSIELSSNSPASSVTPIEETQVSIRIDVSAAQTPTLLDASTAAIELAYINSTALEQDSLFSKSNSETAMSVTDSGEIKFTEPSQEAFSGESPVPYSTTSTDVENADISDEFEVNLPIVSIQTLSNGNLVTGEFSPTTLQIPMENSFPTAEFGRVSSKFESIVPFTVVDTSPTIFSPNVLESSPEEELDSSLENLKMATEEIQSPNDLSTPYAPTFWDATGTENDPSVSEPKPPLEIEDSEVRSPAPDWKLLENFTESTLLYSTPIDFEITDVPADPNYGRPAVSPATTLDKRLATGKLSSVPLETSTEIHFSPLVSNEFHSTFQPMLPRNVAGTSSTFATPSVMESSASSLSFISENSVIFTEDIQTTNAVDLLTTYSSILPHITTASIKSMEEENERFSSTASSLYLEDSQSNNLSTEETASSLIPFAVNEHVNVGTAHSMEISEPATPEDGSYSTAKENFSSLLYVSLEQRPISLETNPSVSVIEYPTSGSVPTDPSLLYSTPVNVEIMSSSDDYEGETSTSLAVTSSDEQFAVSEFLPSDAATIIEGSSSMSEEFSGIAELPFDLADTSTFFIASFSEEDTSDNLLMTNEDDHFSSTTSFYLEDSQSNVPTEETFSTSIPFDMSVSPSGSSQQTLIPQETNPSVLTVDSVTGASFQAFGTSNELSEDFISLEPSLSTTISPISGEFKLFETDLTTSDEELVDTSTETPIFESESLEDNSLLTVDEDGSGAPVFATATDQPYRTVSIPEIDMMFVYFPSTEITDTSESSITSDIFATDLTFGTSLPTAVSADSILDATVSLSNLPQSATQSPIHELNDVSSVLPTFSGSFRPFLGSNSPLSGPFEDTVSDDPSLRYSLANLGLTSTSEVYNEEITTASAITSEASFEETSAEGSSSISDEFSGTFELPLDLGYTSAFFIPTELPTSHLVFLSGNSVTVDVNVQPLTEEELSSLFLPVTPEFTTSGSELMGNGYNHASATASVDLEDSQPDAPSEDTLSSHFPFEMSASPSSSFEQTPTPLQSTPLVVTTDSSTESLQSVDTLDESSEDFISFGPSSAEPLMFSELVPLGTEFATPDEGVVEVSTMVPTFENEGSAEHSIITQEEEGSGATTPGFLNATAQPGYLTDSITEIDSTISGVSLSFSLPAASIEETFGVDGGTVTSNVESIGQEFVRDPFTNTATSISGTNSLSSLTGTSTEMSIALTSSTTSDILTTENPPSSIQLPMNVTGTATSLSTLNVTTSLPTIAPSIAPFSSPDPIIDVVTVSLKPPSADNMIASSTETWYNTSPDSSGASLGSSGPSKDSLSLLSTSTTETHTPSTSTISSISSIPVMSGVSLISPVPATLTELSTPVPSTTTSSATLPSFSSSSTNSASVTSISPNSSDIPAPTTVHPIVNLWNLLISRITTANGILSLIKNSTSASPLSDFDTTSGSSVSPMSSTNENLENFAFVTRPFWLVIRPNADSHLAISTSHTLPKETKSTPLVILPTTTPNTEIPTRMSTTDSFPQSDLFLTRPVWLQKTTKTPKLTTMVLTSTKLSSTRTSSTKGRNSIIVTYPHKPSMSNDLPALDAFIPESTPSTTDSPITTTPSSTSSPQLNLSTNADLIVNEHANVKNFTEHFMDLSSSIASVTNDIANNVVVQLNVTTDMGNGKLNSSFHLEKWSEALNLFLGSYPEMKEEEIQSSTICEAARNSILLKSLFCLNQSPSDVKGERFPNLMQLIRRLTPAIIANLTSAMNLTDIKGSAHVTGFDIEHSSTKLNNKETSTESIIPMSTESTTSSTTLMHRSTESFLLNLSTTLLNNVSMSSLPTMLNISLESLMENLAEELKDTQLADVISAINRLSHDIPEGFLESLIQNNNSDSGGVFKQPTSVESAKKDTITTQEPTLASSTVILTTEVHDILQKDFWKTNRRNPVFKLQRIAGTGTRYGPLPSVGRFWWDTTKPLPSIFRPFARSAIGRT